MPQSPLAAAVATKLNSGGANVPSFMTLDADGALLTSTGGGSSTINITAATLVKASAGKIATIIVVASGSTAGSVNDSATIGGASSANQIFAIPSNAPAGTIYNPNFPVKNGIVVTPGSGGTLAVSWS